MNLISTAASAPMKLLSAPDANSVHLHSARSSLWAAVILLHGIVLCITTSEMKALSHEWLINKAINNAADIPQKVHFRKHNLPFVNNVH